MRMRLAVTLLLFLPVTTTLGYEVSREVVDTPSSPVAHRAVYGVVNFNVTRSAQASQSKKLWQEIVRSKFGSKARKGNYVVTLELKRGDETVGRQIIATYKVEQVTNSTPILGGLLGYDSKTEQTLTESSTQWSGRMYNEVLLIEEINNVLKVELATYYSDESEESIKLFSSAASVINEVKGLPLLGLSFIPSDSIKGLSSFLDNQLFGGEKKKLVSKAADSDLMSFIVGGAATPYPNKVDYKLEASNTNSPQMKIRVHFETLPSKFPFNPASGVFLNANPDYVLNIARIDGLSIPEKLKSLSADSSLGKFTTAWLSGSGYMGDDIASRCADLRIELGKKFSSRDAAAIYWALLQNYSTALKKSHTDHIQCVEAVRSTYKQMALEFTKY